MVHHSLFIRHTKPSHCVIRSSIIMLNRHFSIHVLFQHIIFYYISVCDAYYIPLCSISSDNITSSYSISYDVISHDMIIYDVRCQVIYYALCPTCIILYAVQYIIVCIICYLLSGIHYIGSVLHHVMIHYITLDSIILY